MDVSCTRPSFRASLVEGALSVVPWAPWMCSSGPMLRFLRGTIGDVVIADLSVVGEPDERELSVSPIAGAPAPLASPLSFWASLVGYTRIWLPDSVVDVEVTPLPTAEVEARCTICGARYGDGGAIFWQRVRANGSLPTFCYLCGATRPQWRLGDAVGDAHGDPAPLSGALEPAAGD